MRVDEGIAVRLVEAVERLVEQEQSGLGCQGPREQAALALPAREFAEPPLREVASRPTV